jgi:hypothetical protein
MTISDKNTKVLITMSKEMKSELETIAEKEQRSLSNLIVVACTDLLKKYGKG